MIRDFFPAILAAILLGALIIFAVFFFDRNEFSAELAMESDAMSVVNYYYPKRIALQPSPPEANLKLPRFLSPSPRFGALSIGDEADSLITIVVDENQDSSRLFVDKNNNGDLTDDGDPGWDEDYPEYRTKEALIDVKYANSGPEAAVPYPVVFYRYKNRLQDAVIAYRNGYRKGEITLQDTTYRVAVFDDDVDGRFDELDAGALVIDLNRDGVLDGKSDSPEYYALSSPFNVNGTTYRVEEITRSGDRLTVSIADTTVFPGFAQQIGMRAPQFRLQDIDGQLVDLKALRGQVVLLDFWATWCQPWENHRGDLKRIYDKYHHRGFEIIGLSLDYDLDLLKTYVSEHNLRWPQIGDGRGWEIPVVGLYNIRAIPKNLLLDKNGVIRYKDLYGKKLETKVYELIQEN